MKWIKKAPIAITVTDINGNIVNANDKSKKVFKRFGNFVGKNLSDCHNKNSKNKKKMFDEKIINAYTIEKKGIKKLIYQFPWKDENGFAGYGRIINRSAPKIPHFVRE